MTAHYGIANQNRSTLALASAYGPFTIAPFALLTRETPMLFAYLQQLDPLKDKVFWSPVWSTLLAALPVLVLFWLLVPRRWLASKAGAAGVAVALLVAIVVYRMPPLMAGLSFVHGAAFGLLPVGWTIFNAMLLDNLTVEAGPF